MFLRSHLPHLFAVFLFCFFSFCTASVQQTLDQAHPKDSFQELLYLPNGRAVKLISLGFDSPLADSLWLKTLIYYSSNLRGQNQGDRLARHTYLAKAFDLITDLNPEFRTAYSQGGLLLSASNQPEKAIDLLKKGLALFPQEWPMHLNAAVISIQQLHDMDQAYLHFNAAANSPGVPSDIMETLPGILAMKAGEAKPVDILTLQVAGLSATLVDPQTSPPLRDFITEKIAYLKTVRLTLSLSKGCIDYQRMNSRWPESPRELIQSGVLGPMYEKELSEFPFMNDDQLLMIGEGVVTTRELSTLQVKLSQANFLAAVRKFESKYQRLPESINELIQEKVMLSPPRHPLEYFGYRLVYKASEGRLLELVPEKNQATP